MRLNFRETTPNHARFHELTVTFPLSASLPSHTRSRSAAEEERRRVLKLISSLAFNRGQRRQQNFFAWLRSTLVRGQQTMAGPEERCSQQQRSSQDKRGQRGAKALSWFRLQTLLAELLTASPRGFRCSDRPETGPIMDVFTVLELAQDQKSRKPESNQA